MGDDLGSNLLSPGETPHDNVQFLVFCAAVLRARQQVPGAAAGRRLPAPATTTGWAPTRPRRRSSPSSWATSSPTSSSRSRRAARSGTKPAASSTRASRSCRSCRATPATATARARSRSRATSSSSAPCRRARASRCPNIALNVAIDRVARLRRHPARDATTGKGKKSLEAADQRPAAEDDQGEQADHLQRQQLLRRVAEGGRQARAART